MIRTDTVNLYSNIRNLLLKRTKSKRVSHVMGVEGMAIVLAARWGVDYSKTLQSALLHDLAKCLSLEEQREKLKNCTVIPATEEDFNFKNVWHGKVAAQEGHDLFGIKDEDVLNAVAHHSTGAHALSDPGLVLFVADFIEPSRKWDGAEECRKKLLSLSLLEAAHEVAVEKLEHLEKKGMKAHSMTLEMVDYLKEKSTQAGAKAS